MKNVKVLQEKSDLEIKIPYVCYCKEQQQVLNLGDIVIAYSKAIFLQIDK